MPIMGKMGQKIAFVLDLKRDKIGKTYYAAKYSLGSDFRDGVLILGIWVLILEIRVLILVIR